MLNLIVLAAIVFLPLEFTRRCLFSGPKKLPLPPGPPPQPIIGNLKDLPGPNDLLHIHFAKHKDIYGPISSLTVFGQTLVIINDAKLADEVLNKCSSKTSGRPHKEFVSELVGLKHLMPLMGDNAFFRAQRKAMMRGIGTKSAVSKSDSVHEEETARFLVRVRNDPEGLVGHVRRKAGAAILKMAYGYSSDSDGKDSLIQTAEDVVDLFFHATLPGRWWVNYVPALKYIPDWFPGTGFKQTAKAWRCVVECFTDKPFDDVKTKMANGVQEPSYTASLLSDQNVKPGSTDELAIKWSAAAMYAGGADSSVALMSCFFALMILHPDIQRKAQGEVDRVVGNGRLPSFADRPNLPYIDALLKEVLRCYPAAVIGFPHVATEETVVAGYRIPKGANIVGNIWALTHDPNIYKDPQTFNPSRFLSSDIQAPEPDPGTFAFGFGRRACPGRLLAESTSYLHIASFLAVFKISHRIRDGKEVPIDFRIKPGVVMTPFPFEFSVEVRSERAEGLIRGLEGKLR